jgi:hypothetical protein
MYSVQPTNGQRTTNVPTLAALAELAVQAGFDYVFFRGLDYIQVSVIADGCDSDLDLAFLIDGSGSVTETGFQQSKGKLEKILIFVRIMVSLLVTLFLPKSRIHLQAICVLHHFSQPHSRQCHHVCWCSYFELGPSPWLTQLPSRYNLGSRWTGMDSSFGAYYSWRIHVQSCVKFVCHYACGHVSVSMS